MVYGSSFALIVFLYQSLPPSWQYQPLTFSSAISSSRPHHTHHAIAMVIGPVVPVSQKSLNVSVLRETVLRKRKHLFITLRRAAVSVGR
uniref:Putative secreted protein n=1 Tax=Anopheles darlingi TaxID=43151 RepID=A0A2M4D6U8_ANODA